ncbi:phosphoribosylglycinamide synthetase C domain-containing protein [Methylocystis sp.]|uniref:phosphoribosylglycinamide synthetase C domain-containing protein n=1 Tax=Methylocystis sp. TaxID=1911079 RepID=UPI0025DCA317|nr:phosphoribosylglycinamide synthetase C domain-containing protein [Methylocystis sp.]
MRILGIGDYCDLAALYLELSEEEHDVKVYIASPLCRSILSGMIAKTDDWRSELQWVKDAGGDGIILFENVACGGLQDDLRRDGFNVVGGSAFGDRLEIDRDYAQRLLAELGLATAATRRFSSRPDSLRFLREHPGRYVLKFNSPDMAHRNYVGQLDDGRDIFALLQNLRRDLEDDAGFILMDFIEGVEMGVGAYFDGEKFLEPACLDWEHKRFFPGDLGELTGEMGTVATFDRSATFFDVTLARIEPLLRRHRHCGYVNLNTIVNERGIWPLEFTCRFGYPGFAILSPLQRTSWSRLLQAMARRDKDRLRVEEGFSVGVVLTVPPFPYSRRQAEEPLGMPIFFEGALSRRDRKNLHYCEVALDDGQLVTAGAYGWTMVATGCGRTIQRARRNAYRLIERVRIPNMRYRRDIGARLIAADYGKVNALGLLGEEIERPLRRPPLHTTPLHPTRI